MVIIDDLHNYFNFDNYHDGWLIDWWQDLSWCQKPAGYIGRQASCFQLLNMLIAFKTCIKTIIYMSITCILVNVSFSFSQVSLPTRCSWKQEGYYFGIYTFPDISFHLDPTEFSYPFSNFNGAAVWEWLSNFTPQFIMDVITYPCLIKVNPCVPCGDIVLLSHFFLFVYIYIYIYAMEDSSLFSLMIHLYKSSFHHQGETKSNALTTRLMSPVHMLSCFVVWYQFNWLAPGRCGCNFKSIIFKLIIQEGSLGTCYEITFKWMPHSLTNKKSTLVQVMAWCHQATSHNLSQCWLRSMSPYGVTKP